MTDTKINDLYGQLNEIIRKTSPGEKLAAEPKLASELGVSRATLREAMRTFETQGVILRRQGIGTFVVRPQYTIETGLEALESIERTAERIGLQVSMASLEITIVPPKTEELEKLEFNGEKKVVSVSRVIEAEDRPVAYLIDRVPLHHLCPDELDDDFSGSVLDLFLERGTPMLVSSKCDVGAVTADPAIARAMQIQRNDPLLHFHSELFDSNGMVVDISDSYFLPGYFRFHINRRVGR